MSRFIGEVQAEWLSSDPRRMRLLADFSFVDERGQTWTAPAGMVTDGASIPRILWSVAGSPFDGPYRRAAVIHDAGCRAQTDLPRDVARVFYEAMLADGCDADQAMRMYAAVRLFGPTWDVGGIRGLLSINLPLGIGEVEAALDKVLAE